MAENTSDVPKKGSTPPREILYSEAAKHAPRAIEIVAQIMETGDNDNARLGAAKIILSKAIPDLKALELTGADGGAIQLKYIIDLAGGYIPPMGAFIATSVGGNTGSTSVQGVGMAPSSTQDDHGTNGTS